MKQLLANLFEEQGKLLTPLIETGFVEEIATIGGKQYREWQPTRSKLAAAVIKGMRNLSPFQPACNILYLGAAHGYTPSFLSQICERGRIFSVEFAPRVARELVLLAQSRPQILPIIADANQPEMLYYHQVAPVDVVYQDIAQRNQVEIFAKNCLLFLKKGGIGMLAVKARSIDVTKQPSKIFVEVRQQLEENGFKVLDYRNLEPMQKDHAFFVCAKR